jgi:hypothetical protein
MRTLIALLLAALAVTGTATASERDDRRKARKQLADKVLIRFTESATASLDQRLHLCRNGDYVYDSVSDIPEVGTTVQRFTGTWKVVSARFKKGKTTAKVRGMPDDGSAPTTVKITFDGSTTRLDGAAVIVERSDLC